MIDARPLPLRADDVADPLTLDQIGSDHLAALRILAGDIDLLIERLGKLGDVDMVVERRRLMHVAHEVAEDVAAALKSCHVLRKAQRADGLYSVAYSTAAPDTGV